MEPYPLNTLQTVGGIEIVKLLRALKAIGCILLVVLIIFSYAQYKSNNDLKMRLGGLYRSNIMNYKMHVIQMKTYLENETEWNESDLRNLYSKANMLVLVELPDKHVISLYETIIMHYAAELESLASNGKNPEETKSARSNALLLLSSLKGGLVDMLNAGIVQNKDGSFKEDSKVYFELSLPGSEVMKSINEDLNQALQANKLNP